MAERSEKLSLAFTHETTSALFAIRGPARKAVDDGLWKIADRPMGILVHEGGDVRAAFIKVEGVPHLRGYRIDFSVKRHAKPPALAVLRIKPLR